MEQNNLRTKLLAGEKKVGMFLKLTCPEVAEVLGYAGFDFVVIDRQHDVFSDGEVEQVIRGAQMGGTVPVVRLPSPAEEHIIHALDSGAEGLIVPGVTSVETARWVVSASKFFPEGKRGMNGGARAALHGFIPRSDYMRKANEKNITMIMLESLEMLEHLDELFAIDGLDGVFIGPADLSQDMGIPGDVMNQALAAHVKRVCKHAAAHGKFVGIFAANTDQVKHFMALGVSFVSFGTDLGALKGSAVGKLAEFKALL